MVANLSKVVLCTELFIFIYLSYRIKKKYQRNVSIFTIIPNTVYKWPVLVISITLLIATFYGMDSIYLMLWVVSIENVDALIDLYYKK